MRQQLELLKTVPWDVLIVLDACRADYFRELVPEAASVVGLPLPVGFVALAPLSLTDLIQ